MRKSIRSAFTEFSTSVKPIVGLMDRVVNEAPLALRDAEVRAQHHAIQSGGVVLLSGFLESFLRSVCENYFSELSIKGYGMKSLGDDFLAIHLREGAGHLADIVKRETKRQQGDFSDSSEFVRRLVAPIADASKSPAWEAFARTQGNPSAQVIKTMLEGLGIKGGLDSLALAINVRYSASAIQGLLKNLIDVRNECAHTGSVVNIPQPSTVVDLTFFTRVLALGICKLVDQKITNLMVSMATPNHSTQI